ncbi:MAG: hypothetical protein GC192_20345 [Bacteroidetes bacterium]|nr:hypothetical protein [Bacteroidota bacterium]
MPWVLNKTFYIETDIRRMEPNFIGYRVKDFIKQYQAVYQPTMPTIQPPVETVMPLLEEWGSVCWVNAQFGKGGERGKRKLELMKLLQPILVQWGEYAAYLITLGKIPPYQAGFPWLSMHTLRRPTAVSGYWVMRDHQKGNTTMKTSKKPATLLYFHWQASEDNLNWFTIATTESPKLTTKKLDANKRYYFRMYMTNPKGQSDFHFYNRGYAV